MNETRELNERERELVGRNLDLIFEFEKYVLEHPEFAERIPQEAIISLQVEGDEEFNRWSRGLARSQARAGQPLVYIRVKRLGPVRSRIEELELEGVAP
jgi:hypothetical protein